jgi:hypothetical protein
MQPAITQLFQRMTSTWALQAQAAWVRGIDNSQDEWEQEPAQSSRR